MEKKRKIRLRKCDGCGARFLLKEELEKHGKKYYCFVCRNRFYPKCQQCGKRFYRTQLRKLSDGKRICRRCYEDETFVCDGCERIFALDDSTTTDDDTCYCRCCAETRTFYCEDCEVTFDIGHTNRHLVCNGDRGVCESCRDNHYRLCENCGEYWPEDEVHFCDRCEEYYCEGCGHNCGAEEFRSVNLTHQHGDKKGKYLIIKRLIGVEIEAEEGDLQQLAGALDSRCGISEDGSLDSTGVEVLTPPASLNKAEDIIKGACKILQLADFNGTKSCGLHIHLDASDFRDNPVKLARVLRTVYAVEDLLLSMLPESRWHNSYCLRLSNQYGFDSFKGKMKAEDFESKWYKTVDADSIRRWKTTKHDGNGTRYCGLNLHSTMYRGTVEFRYHSGTVEWRKILRWAYILLKILNYSVKRYKDKEIVSLYSQPTTQAKLRKFFEIFRIRKDIQIYMKARIKKFNPHFKYYNNGDYRKRRGIRRR